MYCKFVKTNPVTFAAVTNRPEKDEFDCRGHEMEADKWNVT